jgi:hypothetical protein
MPIVYRELNDAEYYEQLFQVIWRVEGYRPQPYSQSKLVLNAAIGPGMPPGGVVVNMAQENPFYQASISNEPRQDRVNHREREEKKLFCNQCR